MVGLVLRRVYIKTPLKKIFLKAMLVADSYSPSRCCDAELAAELD